MSEQFLSNSTLEEIAERNLNRRKSEFYKEMEKRQENNPIFGKDRAVTGYFYMNVESDRLNIGEINALQAANIEIAMRKDTPAKWSIFVTLQESEDYDIEKILRKISRNKKEENYIKSIEVYLTKPDGKTKTKSFIFTDMVDFYVCDSYTDFSVGESKHIDVKANFVFREREIELY